MKFYLVICKDRFYIYNERREQVYIDANPYFAYEPSKIREASSRLLKKIVDENNLSNANELQFILVENSDAVRNSSVEKELGRLIVLKYSVTDLIKHNIEELSKNPKSYIFEFGVNYDGECYRYHSEKGHLWRGDYSLLALSIEPLEVIKFIY